MEYITHKDHASNRWLVFYKIGGREIYVTSFGTLEEANDFCDINNGVVEVSHANS